MKLPDEFTIPDFILQHVMVAPEDWPEAHDELTAKGRLVELNKCLQNPDVLQAVAEMVKDLAQANNILIERQLTGFHDVVNQQQLIGEIRGLRRFVAILANIHEQLVTKAQPQ